MIARQSFDIPIIGDTKLPWFDADWPWNGSRVQRFIDASTLAPNATPNFIDVDFSAVETVAMHAGQDGNSWDDCCTQMLMFRDDKSWRIVTRAPLRSELLLRFNKDDVDYVFEKQRPFPVIFNLGLEGDFGKSAFTYWNDNESECVIRFSGDQTIRQVVDSLAGWGIVSSRLWLGILAKFPQLSICESYLEDLGCLWPSGAHPLHQIKQIEMHAFAPVVVPADPQKEIRAEALAAVVAGGLAGMTQAAVSMPAGDRVSEVMRSMLADKKYYSWTAEEWAYHLKASKPTIIGCKAWGEIKQWRANQKQKRLVK